MAQYYFHLRDNVDATLDPEGVELPDLAAAETIALEAARDTLSHDIKRGVIDLSYRIDVEDADGSVVYSLPLRQCFAVID